LSNRLCQNVAPKQAMVILEGIENYFKNPETSRKDITPGNIINYEETDLSDDARRTKCIFPRGSNYPESAIHSSKSTNMLAGSALGELLPTYVVYKAEQMRDPWTFLCLSDTDYNCTKSGWFDESRFEDWFQSIALPYLKKRGKRFNWR